MNRLGDNGGPGPGQAESEAPLSAGLKRPRSCCAVWGLTPQSGHATQPPVRKGPPDKASRGSNEPPRGEESLVSEFFRRLLDSGAKSLNSETVRQLLADVRLPREALLQLLTQHTLSQFDDIKQSVYRSVSKELQAVMERTSLADELASALSKLSVEVTMKVQFHPRRDGEPSVRVHKSGEQGGPSAHSGTQDSEEVPE